MLQPRPRIHWTRSRNVASGMSGERMFIMRRSAFGPSQHEASVASFHEGGPLPDSHETSSATATAAKA